MRAFRIIIHMYRYINYVILPISCTIRSLYRSAISNCLFCSKYLKTSTRKLRLIASLEIKIRCYTSIKCDGNITLVALCKNIHHPRCQLVLSFLSTSHFLLLSISYIFVPGYSFRIPSRHMNKSQKYYHTVR